MKYNIISLILIFVFIVLLLKKISNMLKEGYNIQINDKFNINEFEEINNKYEFIKNNIDFKFNNQNLLNMNIRKNYDNSYNYLY